MNILIVEDELPTRRLLTDMVKKFRPDWNIAGATGSVDETLDWLNSYFHGHTTF
jgi:two-component system response regulator LytT